MRRLLPSSPVASTAACAEACLFYTETGDPGIPRSESWSPAQGLGAGVYGARQAEKMLGLARPVTDELLQEWQELLYDSCTLCGRCCHGSPGGQRYLFIW